jgi:hypothetical protein
MRASRAANRVARLPTAPDSSLTARRNPWRIDRRTLLAGTALASTLIAGGLLAPAPASAQQAISIVGSPTPVDIDNANDCIFAGNCIEITTNGDGAFIDLGNSGNLTAGQEGIYTATVAANSAINIVNTGVISSGYSLLWRRHHRQDDRSQ